MNFTLKKSDLNFKVYTVEAKPTVPGAENDIAIISPVPMTNWFMSPEKPSGIPRNDGDVWIQYSVSGNTKNILKQNALVIATISAWQYVNGSWVDREAVSCQNGEWVEWLSYLIKDGDITDFANGFGGFTTRGLGLSSSNPKAKSPTATITDDYLKLYLDSTDSSYYGGAYYLAQKIDLTNKKTIEADVEFTGAATVDTSLRVWTDFGSYSNDNVVRCEYVNHSQVGGTETGRSVLKINVSDLSGEHYIGLYLLAPPKGNTANTSKVYYLSII